MGWPLPQDYLEAVQTPRSSFSDRELCDGLAETNPLGLPRCMSGRFASVFCFQCQDRRVAVRCFLEHVPDQHQRYAAISKFILADDMPCTVPFEYLDQGIQVNGKWYPILKMEWVEGPTFGEFVRTNYQNSIAISLLANYFKELTLDLRRHGIAHGDLQHDNIIVSDEGLRLVDYDGMFVPALAGQAANELGHENYQHPQRGPHHFGPYLDNFSAWVVYTSLRSISVDPGLWQELNSDGDCLLFRRADFLDPDNSETLARLRQHPDKKIRQHVQALRTYLERPLTEVPSLDSPITDVEGQISQPKGSFATSERSGQIPVWLEDSIYMPYGELARLEVTPPQLEESTEVDIEEPEEDESSANSVYISPLLPRLGQRTVTVNCLRILDESRLDYIKASSDRFLLPDENIIHAFYLTDSPSLQPNAMKLDPGILSCFVAFPFVICALLNFQLALTVWLPLLVLFAISHAALYGTVNTKPLMVLTDQHILLGGKPSIDRPQRWGAIALSEIESAVLDECCNTLSIRFRNAATLLIHSKPPMIDEIVHTLSASTPNFIVREDP